MSHTSQNLGMTVLENGDPADLMTVSDNFDAIDAVVGDIATVESSPTASSHAVGEFLLYEGRLYKVTSAISVGGSLILGTNVSAAKIGSEIKSLRDSVAHVQLGYEDTTGSFSFNTSGWGNGIWLVVSQSHLIVVSRRNNVLVTPSVILGGMTATKSGDTINLSNVSWYQTFYRVLMS